MQNRVGRIVALSCVAWACGGGTEPRVQPCAAGNSIALGALPLAGYSSVTPSPDGCVLFPTNLTNDTVEYVVVAQSGATDPNRQVQFRLAGEAALVAPVAPVFANMLAAPQQSVAAQFDAHLRDMEARRSYATDSPSGAEAELRITQQPPPVGDVRTFRVCSSLNCTPPMASVTAVAKTVGTHLALYVDVTAQNSLMQPEYDEMVATFDQRLSNTLDAALAALSARRARTES